MRFINADDPNIIQMGTEEKQELNLYAYCLNDPVNYVDYNGFQAGTLFNSESSAVRDFAVCYYAILGCFLYAHAIIYAVYFLVRYFLISYFPAEY